MKKIDTRRAIQKKNNDAVQEYVNSWILIKSVVHIISSNSSSLLSREFTFEVQLDSICEWVAIDYSNYVCTTQLLDIRVEASDNLSSHWIRQFQLQLSAHVENILTIFPHACHDKKKEFFSCGLTCFIFSSSTSSSRAAPRKLVKLI